MMDERKNREQRLISDDDVGELIRLAGPRAELPEFDLAAIRAKTCAAWESEVRSSKRRAARVWISRLSVAAALGGAVLLVWWLGGHRDVQSPIEVASIEFVTGSVTSEGHDGDRTPVAKGDRLVAGMELETGHDASRAAIRLANGVSLRLDEATMATLISATVVRLDEGAIYVDTGSLGGRAGRGRAQSIEVRTVSGVARDIGTQFEVRVLDSTRAMMVRVREGRVIVEQDGSSREAGAGTELVVEENGRIAERPVRGWGSGWEWILAAAPRYEIEGRTLHEFLGWIESETGWTIRFTDPTLEARSRDIVLHGTIEGSRPDEAPFAVLAGAGLTGELVDGVLEIREGGGE